MRPTRLASLALLLALAGCDSATGANPPGPPARVDIVSGDLQANVVVAHELPTPLVVRVLDAGGKPVPNQVVNFRVTAGNGSVFAGASQTNSDGEARERWTLGTVAGDTQRVEVRAVDAATGEAKVFATFRAVARPDVAATIGAAAATQFSGAAGAALADSVQAVVRDQYGNTVPGATVTWQAAAGTASPATSVTNAQGIARTQWVLGGSVSSAQTLKASLTPTVAYQFAATGQVSGGAVLSAVSGALSGTVGEELGSPLVVELRQNGVPVEGAQVTWTTPDPPTFVDRGSTPLPFTPMVSVTDAQGRASTAWRLSERVGVHRAYAQIQGVEPVSVVATASPGAPDYVGLRTIDPPVYYSDRPNSPVFEAGAQAGFQAFVIDRFRNPLPGVDLQLAVSNANAGSVSPGRVTTNASGQANITWSVRTVIDPLALDTENKLTASLVGGTLQASVNIWIIPAEPATLKVRPDTIYARSGAGGGPSIGEFRRSVFDRFGNATTCKPVWSSSPPEGPGGPVLYRWGGTLGYPVDVISTPVSFTIIATCGAAVGRGEFIIRP
ncbi:MAG TPA: Ig-like domain-containing protein [Longimicrobiaceae bacterium]|nr:Ig-like domain-containing protein [Longimicrobiaceae bacterium]